MVVVDSSALIEYLGGFSNPASDWLNRQRSFRNVLLPNLVLTEVLQGIRDERRFLEVESALSRFRFVEIDGWELSVLAARNFRNLRGLGITIRSTIDCLLATFCIENDHQLLHRDRDFDAFEQHLGLRVVKA
jgi:predicted nucleic acid-binding protein